MNATLALCAAVLSAAPAAQPSSDTPSVYSLAHSEQFELVIRGQAPADGYPQPTFTQPGVPDAGTYGAPGAVVSPGAPAYGGTPYGGSPYGMTAPVGPDPFLGADPGYMPGGPFQEGRWGWYVGYDNVFVKPYFERNPGSATLFFPPFPTLPINIATQNIDWNLEYSPRMWVGIVEPDGNGFQAKYWMFDHTTSGAGGKQGLDLDVLDLEKTWHYNLQRSALSVTAGVRLASLDQNLRTTLSTNLIPGVAILADSKRKFDGLGPTVSISGRKRVGYSNWALFASTRLSALYGESNSTALFTPAPILGTTLFATTEKGDDLIAVTELQLGADWSAPVWYSTRFFLRAALEGQMWFGAGNAALPIFSTSDSNLGFFGFTVGTGLTY